MSRRRTTDSDNEDNLATSIPSETDLTETNNHHSNSHDEGNVDESTSQPKKETEQLITAPESSPKSKSLPKLGDLENEAIDLYAYFDLRPVKWNEDLYTFVYDVETVLEKESHNPKLYGASKEWSNDPNYEDYVDLHQGVFLKMKDEIFLNKAILAEICDTMDGDDGGTIVPSLQNIVESCKQQIQPKTMDNYFNTLMKATPCKSRRKDEPYATYRDNVENFLVAYIIPSDGFYKSRLDVEEEFPIFSTWYYGSILKFVWMGHLLNFRNVMWMAKTEYAELCGRKVLDRMAVNKFLSQTFGDLSRCRSYGPKRPKRKNFGEKRLTDQEIDDMTIEQLRESVKKTIKKPKKGK